MNRAQEDAWIRQKAEEEGAAFVAAGSVARLPAVPAAELSAETLAARLSFAKFVEHARLKLKLTKPEFAAKARIPLEELVCIEEDDAFTPKLRTVHQLAQFLKVSQVKLLTLAGLAQANDSSFYQAPVRYAAMSEPIRSLSREEREAFDEFVKFLSER